ncbi:hypothetical protein PIB30_066914 [Stylosanthes scabra]|uniref:Transposase (Putative), gypsy type n=1 Tax=Stylosanthes scabra TaxID=79078 RepID=A0ABU6RMU3_9FABA|nr:hypothetical protein [Stylosanthes scabra]
MAKKKSCQNVRNPRVVFPVERELYGWVDAEVFTQSSVLTSEHLPELHREMRLAQDPASERDFVLEVAGPSNRLLFQALEDKTHFLWVYAELFKHLGVRLPFSNFQREVLTQYRVVASQLHINGWDFLRTFERVCLHFGFHPSWRIFLYTYQLPAPPPENSFLSFRAYQGRRLFDAFEEECRVTALDPLETLAFEFLQSLLGGLGKRSNFRCRWILDHSDAEFAHGYGEAEPLQSLTAEDGRGGRGGPSFGPSPSSANFDHFWCFCLWSGCSCYYPIASPPPDPPLAAVKTKGGSSGGPTGRPFSVEREDGAKEDLSADLKKKGRKRKVPEASAEEAALGADSAWEHKVSPINRAFPDDYNFRAALDAGLTNGPTREILNPLVPKRLLGTAQHLACQLTACIQVGIEKAFAAKVQMEKELSSMKDQVDLLTVERDSALAAPLLNAKIKSLAQELEVAEGERLSALARMKETVLDEAEAAAAHWRDEWKSLVEETGEMVQETFEILMDQVRHLNPAIDYSMISLDTRWDPKAKRIYNPKAKAQEQSEPAAEERPDPAARVPLGEGDRGDLPEGPAGGAVVEEGGGFPV